MKILFQGDSITDNFTDHSDPHAMGEGYTLYASEAICARHPSAQLEFLNFGISGNRTCDIVARLERDCIAHDPDLVSLLVGINDVWHRAADKSWLPNDEFEENYRTILQGIKEKTHAKILILEPFLLDVPDKAFFREDLDFKIDIVRRLAREYADAYIPLDGIFAAASVTAPMTLWAADGVHPTKNGAKLIARHYANAFDKLFAALNV